MTLGRRAPRAQSLTRVTTTLALLVIGFSAAACSPGGATSGTATESSGTIASAVRGDDAPTTDTEKALDRIAQAISSDSETVLASIPEVYEVVGARRIQDWAVEFVYRYRDRVDAEIQAAVIASNTGTLESYMDSGFFPIATRLGVPDTKLLYSYFQPDGDHIVTIACGYIPEDDWRQYSSEYKLGGNCSESSALAEAYDAEELIAP